MSRFTPTRQKNPCLCGDTSGKCREVEELRLCMEYTDRHQSVPGWQFVGRTKDGLWGKWLLTNKWNQSKEEQEQWRQEQALKRQLRQQAEAQRRAAALSPQERDRHYRNLLSQLTLHPDDQADLIRRGLTSKEIKAWEVKSVESWQKLESDLPHTLAGVALDGYSLNVSKPGYLCPVFDVEGYIVGFQLRLRPKEKQRYRWLSSRSDKYRPNGPTPHLPNGELPLAVHRPTQITRRAIALTEGVGVKPFLTAHRRGQITVGAAGGQFASSPQTLKDTLKTLTAETGTNLIEFAVDAGAINNPKVLRQYRTTWKLLQSWGFELLILWWGQISKADRDIDELDNLACIEAITVEQFEAITYQGDGIFDRLLRWLKRPQRQQPAPAAQPTVYETDSALVEYKLGERSKTWQAAIQQGKKFILDLSTTGSGKSYSAGQLSPELLGADQLIYASEQHRNPTVDTLSLENGWMDLEARHGGLVREKTAEGGTRLRRAKPGETHVVSPNCNRIKLLNVLRDKNVAEADTANRICGTCPVKSACQNQKGPGYGFLSQRRDALTSPKLRAHPYSLPDPVEYSYSDVGLIWEEAANSFTTSRSIQVNKSDLQGLINHLLLLHPDLFQQVQPLLTQLLNLFNGNINTDKFGIDHLELASLLPTLDGFDPTTLKQASTADLGCLNTTAKYGVDLEDLPKALQKQFLEKDATLADEAEQQILKQWFVELVAILQGDLPGGSVYFHQNRLTLTLPDDRHRAIAQAAKTNIFLDATLSREDLALKLGCQPDEIFVCRQKQPCLNNLKLTQVIDMGIMGMQRGANQQKRLAALITYLRESGIITKAIDFKKFEQDGAHWRDSRGVNYFSQTTTLIIVGAPCPNLHEMLAQYAALVRQVVSKDDPGFQAWLNRQIEAEIQQEIGRLRANRRPAEQLHVVLVTDRSFSFPVAAVKASDITPAAATKKEQVILAAKQAIEWLQHQGEKITQTAVAAATKSLGLNEGKGYSQQHLSRFWGLLTLLIEGMTSKMSKPEPDSQSKEEMEKIKAVGQILDVITSDPDPETVLEEIEQIFWDWLQPHEWLLVWQAISSSSQLAILSALLKTLPIEQLRQLEDVVATG